MDEELRKDDYFILLNGSLKLPLSKDDKEQGC